MRGSPTDGSPGRPHNRKRLFVGLLLGANVPGLVLFAPALVVGDVYSGLLAFAVSFVIALIVTLAFLLPLYFYLRSRSARLHWRHSLLVGGLVFGLFYAGFAVMSLMACRAGTGFASGRIALCDGGHVTTEAYLLYAASLFAAVALGAVSGLIGWLIAFGPRRVVQVARFDGNKGGPAVP